LRHSLAEFLAGEVDPVVTMKILRHIRLATTAEIYIHHVTKKQQAAQGLFLKAIGKTERRTNRKNEGKTALAGWDRGLKQYGGYELSY
jgi:hypothetical protein